MKKLFSMVLIAALFFCMAACAGTTNEIQSVGAESSAQTESSSASMDTSAPAEEETASPVEGNWLSISPLPESPDLPQRSWQP